MKCSDPYWINCTDVATYHRPRTATDRPDTPEYLCEDCFLAMSEESHSDKTMKPLLDEFEWIEGGE